MVEKDPSAGTWSRGARLIAVLVLFAATLALAVFFALRPPAESVRADVARDGDFCPVDPSRVAGSATYLLDLGKPLADATTPGRLLRDVTRALGAEEELFVFALTADANAPKRLVDRLCKPYGEAAIRIQADKNQGLRDCDDLPAQLSMGLRDLASRFCARRNGLAARIDQLAANSPRKVDNAYLIEALEETTRELARRTHPRKLYIFSDMIQHAAWYSHVDLPWSGWNFAAFSLRKGLGEALPESGVLESGVPEGERGFDLTVFYPIRAGRTERLRPRHAHQTFWRSYFRELHGAEVAFRELPVAPRFDSLRLMPRPTDGIERDIEAAQRTIEKLRRHRAAAEAAGAVPVVEEPKPAPPAATSRQDKPAPQAAPPASASQPPAPTSLGESAPARSAPPPAQAPADTVASAEPPVAAVEPSLRTPPSDLAAQKRQTPDLPVCAVSLLPDFTPSLASDGYPGARRVNYGAGVVTVHYSLDAQGNTTEVRAVVDSPSRPSAADRLAQDTAAEVRRWRFALEGVPPGGCVPPAKQVATFTYKQKCVGSPLPTCRTVRAGVAVRQQDAPHSAAGSL